MKLLLDFIFPEPVDTEAAEYDALIAELMAEVMFEAEGYLEEAAA